MKKKSIIILFFVLLLSNCVAIHDSSDSSVLESYNKGMFKFNDTFDEYLLKPLAQGYINVTNKTVRKRVTSVFTNIVEPLSAANHVLQGDFGASATSVARFGINSTLGLLGAFDVASGWGLAANRTNFDDTLATWCVPDGPYIILPFLGPATPRSTVGIVADSMANPVYIASHSVKSEGSANTLNYGYTGPRTIVARADAMLLLNDLKENSVDYYAALKTMYLQNRQTKKCMFGTKEEINYDFDFDLDAQ